MEQMTIEQQRAIAMASARLRLESEPGLLGALADTWPARLAKSAFSAAKLPGDVFQGKVEVDPNNPEFMERAVGLATMAAPVNPAIRAGDRMVAGSGRAMTKNKPVVPSTKELYDEGVKDFDRFRASGLEVTSDAVKGYAESVRQKLYEMGIHPVDANATYAKLETLANAPPGSFSTASNLKSLRDSLGTTAQNFNPQAAEDQAAATVAIKELDRFIPNVAPKDVLAGSPSASAALWERARGNAAASYRSNDITGNLDRATTGILERSEGRAQAANSGRNLDNTIRQKTEAVLEKPKEISGYSDAELAALERVVQGGAGRNVARYTGNLLGGGGGMGQSLWGALGAGTGAVAGGGVPGAFVGAMIPAAVGSGAKSIANALAKKDLRAADELIRKRSPLFTEQPTQVLSNPDKRAALIRLLMLQEQQ